MFNNEVLKKYLSLTKPGIILGNAATTTAAFFLASRGRNDIRLLFFVLFGLSCIIASACLLNNYMDREIDKKMARTKNRAFAIGSVSVRSGMIFSAVLGISGSLVLIFFTNLISVFAALLGFIVYVLLYSRLKYRSTSATLVGSISGAVPPVVGYCAVSNRLDAGVIILFMMLVIWQMPHFFSSAILRREDYAAASIPILPVIKGIHFTKVSMLVYIAVFIVVSTMLTLLGYTGFSYLVIAVLIGLSWLVLCLKGLKQNDDHIWARNMFHLSLAVLLVLCVAISLDSI